MTKAPDIPEQAGGTELPNSPETVPTAEAVRVALDGTGYGWLRRVEISTEGGCVVLRGRVPSFYLKQLALGTVLAVPGVKGLRNELEVEGGNR
jgi:osmotically-inducible protein OsmY